MTIDICVSANDINTHSAVRLMRSTSPFLIHIYDPQIRKTYWNLSIDTINKESFNTSDYTFMYGNISHKKAMNIFIT